MDVNMDILTFQNEMKELCKAPNWRKFVDLINDGFKGMYNVLRILQESDRELTPSELAKQMDVSTARIATALNNLEAKGYILRSKPTSDDARRVAIALTEAGNAALEKRKKYVAQTVAPMLDRLSSSEAELLFELLKKFLS